MDLRNPWPIVVLASVGIITVAVLAILRIDTAVILVVLGSTVFPIVTAALYGKVSRIESNSNGTTGRTITLLEDMMSHVKGLNSVMVAHMAQCPMPTPPMPGVNATATPPTEVKT